MAYNLHFRPRPIDVNVPLPVLHEDELDNSQLLEIEQESSHFTEIKAQRKKKKPEEEDEEPLLDLQPGNIIEVAIPHVRVIHDDENKPEEFKRPPTYILSEDKTRDELDYTIEYDLESDDEDFLWAYHQKHMKNARKGKPLITEDDMESTIDLFEKESFKSKFSDPDDIEIFQSYRNLSDNTPCCICNRTEEDDGDALLICEGCGISVHQICYGVEGASEESWKCRKCESGEKNVSCVFCPNTNGAFKRTSDGRWAHVVCALWIPNVSFDNHKTMEQINRINHIPKKLWNQECSICNRRSGVCIHCSETGCKFMLHITCVRNRGYYTEIQRSTKDKSLNSSSYAEDTLL